MLADVQAHFGLTRPLHRVGNFETDHQCALIREVCAVVQTGRLVVVAGLVGSGKTHLLTRIEEELAGPTGLRSRSRWQWTSAARRCPRSSRPCSTT